MLKNAFSKIDARIITKFNLNLLVCNLEGLEVKTYAKPYKSVESLKNHNVMVVIIALSESLYGRSFENDFL